MACDACRHRKIKCDGGNPCRSCISADIGCSYDLPRLKKGPKRSRQDSAIGQLRAKKVLKADPLTAVVSAVNSEILRWDRFSRESLRTLILDYFDSHHTMTEILECDTVVDYLDKPPTSLRYCMVMGIAAYQKVVGVVGPDGKGALEIVETLLHEALRAHQISKVMEKICEEHLIGNFFIFAVYFNLQKFSTAWIYLREAITVAQILGFDNENSYALLSEYEALRRRLLFYVLFATERGVSLLTMFPVTLKDVIAYPNTDPSVKGHDVVQLARLFKIIDDFATLTETSRKQSDMDAESIVALLCKQLDDSKALADNMHSDVHRADLLISAEWIRLLICKSFLSAYSTESQVSILVSIADSIIRLGQQITKIKWRVHGVGMAMKLSEILTSMADTCGVENIRNQLTTSESNVGARISELLNLICKVRYSSPFYASLYPALLEPAFCHNITTFLETSRHSFIEQHDTKPAPLKCLPV
jgi:hypothetical protein